MAVWPEVSAIDALSDVVLPEPVVVVVVVVAVLAGLFAFKAFSALSAGDGEVRTKVPVSLRGTALRLASIPSCGVLPTVAGADAVAAGMGVWADALNAARASTAPSGNNLVKRFMAFPY